MNPIALVTTVLGVALFLSGIYLAVKRRRMAGVVLSLVGLAAMAVPVLISFYLARSAPVP